MMNLFLSQTIRGVRRIFPVLAPLLVVALRSTAAEEEPSLQGIYRDERVVVELGRPTRSGDRARYTGTIQVGEQKFPLNAEAEGIRLKGTFESQGEQFGFTGSIVGRMFVLTTEGATYRLKKDTANPLARLASKPNPLAQTRTNFDSAAGPTNGSAVSTRANTLRFRSYSVMDDPSMIGGEAFRLLVPADWQVEGGLAWRMHPAVPALIALRISNSNRTEVLETFPTIPFAWAEGGIPLFPAGSKYMGNEVAEPIEDPAAYIKQVVLPRFRQNVLTPQVVATEELPRIAEAIAENTEETGVQKSFRAGRVRIEYTENGNAVQEDIYCVLVVASVPAIRTTFWGPDRNYSFKAEKGKLEARTRVFQTMLNSFKPNLQWFNRYLQLVQVLAQGPFDSTRRVSELGRYLAQTTDEISDLRRQTYLRQQTERERINASFSRYISGMDGYRNPIESRTVELPAEFPGVWTNSRGEYLLSDDISFNPNNASNRGWQRLQKSR